MTLSPERPPLAWHEERAQRGILEFAEELRVIRDERLYPNAARATGSGADDEKPWAVYCRGRWNMTGRHVNKIILAAPVIARQMERGHPVASLHGGVWAATIVATLDVAVQDAILDSSTTGNDVAAKAKAVRKVAKAGLSVDAQIAAAEAIAATPPKKKKPKVKASRFVELLGPALHHVQVAADYAQTTELDAMENDWGWDWLDRIERHVERLRDKMYRPLNVRDVDAEAAVFLGGDR